MDPVSITSLCFVVLKNAGLIVVEFRTLKSKIGGAAHSLEQLMQYVATLQTAINELLGLIHRGRLSGSHDTTETIKGTLEKCDGELLLILKFISKIKPRPGKASLGFKGTFWSLWNEDAVKASKDVLRDHIQSLNLLLQIIDLGSTRQQQDQAIQNASDRGQIVVKTTNSQASQRLRDFVTSLEAHSGDTVQRSTEQARLAAEWERGRREAEDLVRRRQNSRLESDLVRQRERREVEAAHKRTIEQRIRSQSLGLPEELPPGQRWERLFEPKGSHGGAESSAASFPASRPRRDISNSPLHANPSQLMFACAAGDTIQVTNLIDAGHDVNEGRGNMTALHIAAATGNAELARTLLSRGAKVEARDVYGQTALHVAAFSNASDVVRILIRDGADVECIKTESADPSADALWSPDAGEIGTGWRPLHCAADQGHTGVAGVLIDAGARVMSRTNDGSTSLHLACAKAHVEMARVLLYHAADPGVRTSQGIRPIDLARTAGSEEIIQCLWDVGAS